MKEGVFGLILLNLTRATIAVSTEGEVNILEQVSSRDPFPFRQLRIRQQFNVGGKKGKFFDYFEGFFIRTGELVNKHFLEMNLQGIIIGGTNPFLKVFITNYLENRLQEQIIAIIDAFHAGEEGINALMKEYKKRELTCLFCGTEEVRVYKVCKNCIDHIMTRIEHALCPKCRKMNLIKINPTDWTFCINCGWSFNPFKEINY